MPTPDRATFEQAILDDPEFSAGGAVERWLVLADWLQAHDDPRGTLIAEQAAWRGEAILAAHQDELLGEFAGKLARYVDITWYRGFWRMLRVFCDFESGEDMPEEAQTTAAILRDALAHPSARLLHELRIGLAESHVDGDCDWEPSIAVLVESGPWTSLRKLVVGDFEIRTDTEISWTWVGSLAAVWAALPRLEALEVQGAHIELGAIHAPNLRRFAIRSGGLEAEPVRAIAAADLPALEHLEVWFGSRYYGAECTVDDAVALLQHPRVPALRSLGLRNAEFADALPAAILASPLLPRLRELDLSLGALTDDGVAALIAMAPQLAHLDELRLDRTYATPAAVERLRAALPTVAVSAERLRPRPADDERYVAVGE